MCQANFFMNSDQAGAFPNSQLLPDVITVPGFPQTFTNGFRNFSLTHTYTITSHLLNQAVLGFHRLAVADRQDYRRWVLLISTPCAARRVLSRCRVFACLRRPL